MKKIIFTAIVLGFAPKIMAQSAVKAIPKNTHGYIILKDVNNNIDCWQIDFFERKFQNNAVAYVPLKSERVCGKDYLGMPDGIGGDITRDIYFSVSGSESNGTKHNFDQLVSTGTFSAFNGTPQTFVRRAGVSCDGQSAGRAYAYDLSINELTTPQNPNGTGGGSVFMAPASRYQQGSVFVPFYACVEINNLQNHFAINYSWTPIMYQSYLNPNTTPDPLLVSPILYPQDLPSGTAVMNPSNQWINGPYRMVAKNLSQYRPALGSVKSNVDVATVSQYNLSAYMNLVNNSTEYQILCSEEVKCLGNGFAMQGTSVAPGELDCLPINNTNLVNPTTNQFSPGTYFQGIQDCFGVYEGGTYGQWWDQAHSWVELVYDVEGNTPGAASGNDPRLHIDPLTGFETVWAFNQAQGVYINKGTLKPGIYKLGMVFNNGDYFPLMFEVKETLPIISELKDLMNVNFFPVPITGNNYSMEVETGFSGKVIYQLFDSQGTKIYEETLDLQKTTGRDPYTIRINVPTNIPNGLLFNKFICPDGSIYTETTIK
ncbi:hypothetical protein [Fluviicola chungangensis]|uniref:T9SS type A sorting domain-containing protein n=1 Tax=Fluviicola chungangensis TaxID=2597671 RepID=A0A556MQD6_9FLAO|nr:hypothetical protein [Fluviicola chungangensis]TSJ42018.1 hypothetical protein FO442_13080 [Fluviicola chungangensis]